MNRTTSIKAQTIQKYFSVNTLDDSFFILDNKTNKSENTSSNIIPTSFPIKLDVGSFILCESGYLKINIGYMSYTVYKNECINILANRVFQVIEVSDDFEAKILCLKPHYLDINNSMYNSNIRNILYEHPHQKLPEPKLELFNSIFKYCQSIINDTKNNYRKQLINSILNTLFLEICDLLSRQKHTISKTPDIEGEIFIKFMKQVEADFRSQRSVLFYAKKALLSPKYFSLIIYKLTGKHAKAWIDEYTILEIKALLKSTNLTIQQLSYDLNFATPSHFGRYFKHHTGFSPNQYRKDMSNELSLLSSYGVITDN